ncbi:hypothetical protein NMY22_g4723 [Coprinellus aureogranulatus]|nr:hypothetical protein NMY22_g4723 [Coprinellus aureogranulatus]
MSEPKLDSGVWSFGERVSALFGVEAAALSAISIVLLIVYKIYRMVLHSRAGGEADACDSSLFLSLMLGESLRAIGKIMTIRWIVEARIISPTTFCTAQGVIQLLGTNLIDWTTLAITIQTTFVLVAQWRTPPHFAKYLVLAVWVIVALIVGISLGVGGLDMIGPADGWCWIQTKYKAVQLLSEYLWMWIICILTGVLYVIDALVIRGFVAIDGWRLRWVSRDRVLLSLTEAETQEEHEKKKLAMQLFFYPLVYFVCIAPFSVVRHLIFEDHRVSHHFQAFVTVLFSLSGFFNVILFFKTRPALITGGDIPHGPVEVLPDLHPSPSTSADDGHKPHASRDMEEKRPADGLFLEINSSQGRERAPHRGPDVLPRHRQVSRDPTSSPGKYEYDEDVGQLPP